MPYLCELGAGQRIYLDNQGIQTIITTLSSSPGQQQQATNSINTGNWASIPEIYQIANGIAIKIKTAQGETWIQVQGSNITQSSINPNLGHTQQMQVQQIAQIPGLAMQPMQPMSPMQPMTMGNMSMNMQPMEMKMGNMSLKMGESAQVKRFCSQCGAAIQERDRFCSSCGNALT